MALLSSRGDTRSDLVHGAPDSFRTFAWLEDDRRPLDWNGPANRLFTRFRDQDLQQSIIEHFERVAHRQAGRIAIRDADTALTFGEAWDEVTRLAETLRSETKPGDLIGILLPACPMFPIAMLRTRNLPRHKRRRILIPGYLWFGFATYFLLAAIASHIAVAFGTGALRAKLEFGF